MDILEIQSDIEALKKNVSLLEEVNFDGRADALDYIEFHIIDRIEGLLQKTNPLKELLSMKQYAEKIKVKLEKINASLFQRRRMDIQTGVCTGRAFRDMVSKYVQNDLSDDFQQEKIGYDNLDIFINGLFPLPAEITDIKKREPEMVFYQKTPARIIFELVEKAHFTEEDVFYDLGSGLGQVSILVNLLSGIKAKGVEFEPAYSNYAKECATSLNLPKVEFINSDVRKSDYSNGTVFFMFTPFEGRMLQEVLDILQQESLKKKIKLFTYGPCTSQVASQNWLKSVDWNNNDIYKLCEFRSF